MKNQLLLLAITIASTSPIFSTPAALAQCIDVHTEPVNRFKMPLNEFPLERNLSRSRQVSTPPTTVRSGEAPKNLLGLPTFATTKAPFAVPVFELATRQLAKPQLGSPWSAAFGHPNQAPLVASNQRLPDAARTPATNALYKPAIARDNQTRSATTTTQAVPIDQPNHQKHLRYVPASSKIADYNGKFFGPLPRISEHSEDERRSSTSVVGVVVRKH